MENIFYSNLNLREIIALFCFFLSMTFSFISMIKCSREHSLKISALFLLGLISLFANSSPTYFLSVLIIATGVTQLEFIQNIATIIRGNGKLVNLTQSTQTLRDINNSFDCDTAEENVNIENENDCNKNIGICNEDKSITISTEKLSYELFGLLTHELAFKKLEKQYRYIERYPKFTKNGGENYSFDGIIEDDNNIKIFIIKTAARQSISTGALTKQTFTVINKAIEFSKLRNKKLHIILAYIVSEKLKSDIENKLHHLSCQISNNFDSVYFIGEIFTYGEIGLYGVADELRERRKINIDKSN